MIHAKMMQRYQQNQGVLHTGKHRYSSSSEIRISFVNMGRILVLGFWARRGFGLLLRMPPPLYYCYFPRGSGDDGGGGGGGGYSPQPPVADQFSVERTCEAGSLQEIP